MYRSRKRAPTGVATGSVSSGLTLPDTSGVESSSAMRIGAAEAVAARAHAAMAARLQIFDVRGTVSPPCSTRRKLAQVRANRDVQMSMRRLLPLQPWGCIKSDHNYAHLAAPRLGLDLRDPSCSGAETEDMTATQGVFPDPNPPQFDALTADTALVTLGIGGNDSGAGCWPVIPVAQGDAVWLRDKEKELNQMLADQAAAGGATLVDWYTPSIGHDACQPPGIKWVEGLVPNSGVAPVHPNLVGMLAATDLVVAAVQAG